MPQAGRGGAPATCSARARASCLLPPLARDDGSLASSSSSSTGVGPTACSTLQAGGAELPLCSTLPRSIPAPVAASSTETPKTSKRRRPHQDRIRPSETVKSATPGSQTPAAAIESPTGSPRASSGTIRFTRRVIGSLDRLLRVVCKLTPQPATIESETIRGRGPPSRSLAVRVSPCARAAVTARPGAVCEEDRWSARP